MTTTIEAPVTATKSGYKTTEFWLTALLIAATTIMGYLSEGSQFYQILMFVTTGLAAAGYSVSRALIKKSNG